MIKLLQITVPAFVLLFILSAPGLYGRSIVQVTYYLAADNNEKILEKLQDYVNRSGGYIKFYSLKKIVLRTSRGGRDDVKKILTSQGYIMDERIYRRDISEYLLQLKTRLGVKLKLAKNLYRIFRYSRYGQTLEVEREIGKVITDIERLKGRIAWYEDASAKPQIVIYLNRNVRRNSRSGSSFNRWRWIQKLGIPSLLRN